MNLLPLFRLPLFLLICSLFAHFIFFFKNRINHFLLNLIFFFGQYSFVNKLLFIKLANWSHFSNLFIHQGLCERWLIKFVVTIFSITDQINNDIMIELLAILSCGGKNVMHIFKTLSINMEDRSINRFSQIRSIVSRSSFAWNCCETDLIINNNMNCSTDRVIL